MEVISIAQLLHPSEHHTGIAKVLYLRIVYSFVAFLFGFSMHLQDGRDLPQMLGFTKMPMPMIYTFQQENIISLMLAFHIALSCLCPTEAYDIILLNGVVQMSGVYQIIF
jgi:hypothetical protein